MLLCSARSCSGLYDRDEALLRKTTLDEAPKLFQLATLCALVAGSPAGCRQRRARPPRGAVPVARARGAADPARAAARVLRAADRAGRALSVHRRRRLAETIRSKLARPRRRQGEVVAHLDLDQIGSWSTDAFSRRQARGDPRPRPQARRAPRDRRARAARDAGEMLDLVRTLKAVGVRSACCRGCSRWSAPRSSSTTCTASP